jgi:uncharacterized phage-associated protein
MAGRRIRFEFSLDKLVDALGYLSSIGKIRDLTKLKAAKLLYFADKAHLLKYGRPILGDRYVSMDHGPVPSQALNVMNSVIAPDEIEDPARRRVLERLQLHKDRPWSKHQQFRLRRHGYEFPFLSGSDREILDEVISRYGNCSVGQLIDLTHQEYAWKVSDQERSAGSSAPMSYRAFFEGERSTEAATMLQFVEEEQENRDFIAALVR